MSLSKQRRVVLHAFDAEDVEFFCKIEMKPGWTIWTYPALPGKFEMDTVHYKANVLDLSESSELDPQGVKAKTMSNPPQRRLAFQY